MGQGRKYYIATLIDGDGYPYDVSVGCPADDCKPWITEDGTLVFQGKASDEVILYVAPGRWHSVRRVIGGTIT